jgi:dsRNA-specific ribonuclease
MESIRNIVERLSLRNEIRTHPVELYIWSQEMRRSYAIPPFNMSGLPALPKISGDIILDVFTHKSLRHGTQETYGDSDRLADLGEKILEMTATSALFNQDPVLSAADISVRPHTYII